MTDPYVAQNVRRMFPPTILDSRISTPVSPRIKKPSHACRLILVGTASATGFEQMTFNTSALQDADAWYVAYAGTPTAFPTLFDTRIENAGTVTGATHTFPSSPLTGRHLLGVLFAYKSSCGKGLHHALGNESSTVLASAHVQIGNGSELDAAPGSELIAMAGYYGATAPTYATPDAPLIAVDELSYTGGGNTLYLSVARLPDRSGVVGPYYFSTDFAAPSGPDDIRSGFGRFVNPPVLYF